MDWITKELKYGIITVVLIFSIVTLLWFLSGFYKPLVNGQSDSEDVRAAFDLTVINKRPEQEGMIINLVAEGFGNIKTYYGTIPNQHWQLISVSADDKFILYHWSD